MSESDGDSSSVAQSRRNELKKLHFQKSAELKKAKSKSDKKSIEDKYALLELALLGPIPDPPITLLALTVLPDSLYKETELSKSLMKKERKLLAAQVREANIRKEVGDGMVETERRNAEMTVISSRLPHGYIVRQIPADGDCMFSSICLSMGDYDVSSLRTLAADYLLSHREEFEPFVEDVDFATYCESIALTQWGGSIELEVLSRALHRNILVYTEDALLDFGSIEKPTVRLSFHRHQFSSNHYNAVVLE